MIATREHSMGRATIAAICLIAGFSIFVPPGSSAPGEDDLVALARTGNRVLIADFGLGMCMQCRKQAEILGKVRNTYKDKVLVRMVQVNKEQALTEKYRVETIPHLIFFDPGGNVRYRKTGVMSFEAISVQLADMGVNP